MGNDGGSIPTRRELVKEAARNPTTAELKESQHEQQEHCWKTDPISNQPLAQPVVSDSSGKLYNKDTILEFLVDGSRKADAERITQGAIKSLKDVVEVRFEVDHEATALAYHEIWRCPVTGDKLGPGSKAVYLVPCGHAFSGTAIKEVSGEKCLSCETEYASNDIIPILSMADMDVARLSLRLKTLQEKGLSHSLKKASSASKKRKKRDEPVEAGDTALEPVKAAKHNGSAAKTLTQAAGTPDPESMSSINNTSTASLTAKVLEEQERAKKRKMQNKNVQSLFSSRDQSMPIGNQYWKGVMSSIDLVIGNVESLPSADIISVHDVATLAIFATSYWPSQIDSIITKTGSPTQGNHSLMVRVGVLDEKVDINIATMPILVTDLNVPSSEIACFAGPHRDAGANTHDHLSGLDHRIWRGSLIEPDRRIDGHPSWNEVLRLYRDKLRGCSLEDKRVEREMDAYLCLNVYKKQKKEVFCAACEHYLSEEPCLSLDMVKVDIPPQKSRGVWVCEFLVDDKPVQTMVAYEPPGKGYIGYYQFWLTGGGYLHSMGLATKGGFQRDGLSTEVNKHALRAPSHVLGSLDPDTLLRQVDSPVEDGDVDPVSSSNPKFSAINQFSTKRKGTESATGIRKKLPKYGPNSGVFALPTTESATAFTLAPPQPSVGQSNAASMPSPGLPASATRQPENPLNFRPREQHDYSQQILNLFRRYESVQDCEYTREWRNKARLQYLSASDLEAARKPVCFREKWAGRMFKGSPYSNMEAALTQMSGTELAGNDACEQCQNGNGPFTTCVVGGDLHNGACANCVYNSEASKCSFRKAKLTSANGQGTPLMVNGNNVGSHVHPHPWTAVPAARQSLNGHDNRSEASSDGLFVRPGTVSSGSELYRLTPGVVLQRIPDQPHAEQVSIRLASSEARPQTYRKEVPQAEMTTALQIPGTLASKAAADRASPSDEASGRREQARTGPAGVSADSAGLFAAPTHDQSRASGSVAASDSAAPGSHHSLSGTTVYDFAFLKDIKLALTIGDDAATFKVDLSGCTTFDALVTKLTAFSTLRSVIPALSCIEFRIENPLTFTLVGPGDVTVYPGLLNDVKASYEQGGRSEMILKATMALSTST
ncbi:Replication termination factor 2 [Elasticomyces elasticus]|nr:Replication termination factor 2 [Elasticomyces elasticus]KAK3657448.1 Replication termination factor 2 [Elasticomyces elasticus]KAK4925685.1 Replication termination factor 2 [Elasticomyces elasticus]KAK5765017.1 Replication termination factor 2 [Elasticomyces elasticus]